MTESEFEEIISYEKGLYFKNTKEYIRGDCPKTRIVR